MKEGRGVREYVLCRTRVNRALDWNILVGPANMRRPQVQSLFPRLQFRFTLLHIRYHGLFPRLLVISMTLPTFSMEIADLLCTAKTSVPISYAAAVLTPISSSISDEISAMI